MTPEHLPSRFWGRVAAGDPRNCWQWLGPTRFKGYGFITLNQRTRPVHRVAYELTVGPIPTGLVLDHLCRNRVCVNPLHLEPVTNRENILRGEAPSAVHALKTHCPQGHEYNPENTRISKGRRHCRLCQRITRKARALASTASAR